MPHDRLIEELRDFLNRPGKGASPGEVATFRRMAADLADAAFEMEAGQGAPVAFEVFDARRERVYTLRAPHMHKIRDPHAPGGVSLGEAMESLELVALTSSQIIRSVTAELAHQESDREAKARHIAVCDPVRRWGEHVAEHFPRAGRLLINYAIEGVMPSMIPAEDAAAIGLAHQDLAWLLGPSGAQDLRARLVAFATQRLEESAKK